MCYNLMSRADLGSFKNEKGEMFVPGNFDTGCLVLILGVIVLGISAFWDNWKRGR